MEKKCPSCNSPQFYVSKRQFQKAVKENRICRSCNNKKSSTPENKCIDCSASITKNKAVQRCKSCAGKIRGTTMPSSLGRKFSVESSRKLSEALLKHHRERRCSKHVDFYREKKVYYNEVRRITRQQPIHLLENYDKEMGRGCKEGVYQLDHIISRIEGFRKGINPQVIGGIGNLRIIESAANNKKGTEEQKLYGFKSIKA